MSLESNSTLLTELLELANSMPEGVDINKLTSDLTEQAELIEEIKNALLITSELGSTNITQEENDALITRTITSCSWPISTIRDYAFAGCEQLTTVSLPAATTISNWAFYNCYSLTTVSLPAATTIGYSAFYNCYSLTTVSLPAATTIGYSAFYNCYSLTTVSLPAATTISNWAFYNCYSLTTVSLPAATTIGDYAFNDCRSLTTVSLPAATTIGNFVFYRCSALTSLYLMNSVVCTLSGYYAFLSTPMSDSSYTGKFGSIYVPASLLASYKAATNWSRYSSRFVGV